MRYTDYHQIKVSLQTKQLDVSLCCNIKEEFRVCHGIQYITQRNWRKEDGRQTKQSNRARLLYDI